MTTAVEQKKSRESLKMFRFFMLSTIKVIRLMVPEREKKLKKKKHDADEKVLRMDLSYDCLIGIFERKEIK